MKDTWDSPDPKLTRLRALVAGVELELDNIGKSHGEPSAASLRSTWSELVKALALGTIAWELWRAREPTSPRLALERFADFEGTVRFEERQVRVRLPLGKRHRDLEAAGFLADVPRVPWLDYRSVVFSGG